MISAQAAAPKLRNGGGGGDISEEINEWKRMRREVMTADSRANHIILPAEAGGIAILHRRWDCFGCGNPIKGGIHECDVCHCRPLCGECPFGHGCPGGPIFVSQHFVVEEAMMLTNGGLPSTPSDESDDDKLPSSDDGLMGLPGDDDEDCPVRTLTSGFLMMILFDVI